MLDALVVRRFYSRAEDSAGGLVLVYAVACLLDPPSAGSFNREAWNAVAAAF